MPGADLRSSGARLPGAAQGLWAIAGGGEGLGVDSWGVFFFFLRGVAKKIRRKRLLFRKERGLRWFWNSLSSIMVVEVVITCNRLYRIVECCLGGKLERLAYLRRLIGIAPCLLDSALFLESFGVYQYRKPFKLLRTAMKPPIHHRTPLPIPKSVKSRFFKKKVSK